MLHALRRVGGGEEMAVMSLHQSKSSIMGHTSIASQNLWYAGTDMYSYIRVEYCMIVLNYIETSIRPSIIIRIPFPVVKQASKTEKEMNDHDGDKTSSSRQPHINY
jgi:hypothetical protein